MSLNKTAYMITLEKSDIMVDKFEKAIIFVF